MRKTPYKRLKELFKSIFQSINNKVANLIETESEYDVVTNTPLHIAVRDGNNKIVDIILSNMSLINENVSKSFKDIFDKLIIFQEMKHYINKLPMATNQMMKKQVIKCKSAESDEIIKMTDARTIYVDAKFYRD